ncbi:hypothetical protein [uncultured Photobacterium sp.]|uniref:hypothetical protein n=1 Tax=uncultured Photobacterium sp. TaxID=173973 RepID=UPI0026260F39|nr:hypothetical protein [uncultured Photobacterium sp.]
MVTPSGMLRPCFPKRYAPRGGWLGRSMVEEGLVNGEINCAVLGQLADLPLTDMTHECWLKAGITYQDEVRGKPVVKMMKGSDKRIGRALCQSLRVRRAVAQFAGGEQPHLVIDAIEPSLGRDLKALLVHSHPGLELAETQTLPLNGEVMAKWHEDFDREELAGTTELTRYLVLLLPEQVECFLWGFAGLGQHGCVRFLKDRLLG